MTSMDRSGRSEMASAWGVTRGSYSDYRVLCICDTKERAEEIVALSGEKWGDAAEVEEFVLVDHEPQRVRVFGITEELMDSGTSKDRRDTEDVEWEFDMLYPQRNRPVTWRWVRAPYLNNKGGRLEVHGTDRERVRKVFSDRRAMILSGEPLQARREAVG